MCFGNHFVASILAVFLFFPLPVRPNTQPNTQPNPVVPTLVTEGPWIVNSTDRSRIHLRCANWYGAHQELYVVAGLELRSVSDLTDLFHASGANCVRLPYSIEMVKYNPVVRPESVAGVLPSDGCNSTIRALDVMDCVVLHLQRRGILLIFNNHNSWGGWVGAGASKNNDQGLWNLPGYSTEDWIQSMEHITRRYKIAGMDLRNEIHDQGSVKITWGQSSDVDTDWLAASSAAYERLYKVDPDILAIVGGLCWNTDLSAMTKTVGPHSAFVNKKLVYTVHVYTFSFWWNGQDFITDFLTPASFWLSLLCLTASVVTVVPVVTAVTGFQLQLAACKSTGNAYGLLDPSVGWIHISDASAAVSGFVSASLIFHLGWLALAIFYYNTASAAGCSSYAEDSIWLIVLASVLTLGAFVCLLWHLCCYGGCRLLFAFGLVWLGLFFMGVSAVGAYLSSYQSYLDSLKAWSLKDRQVPVWVGEFGTGMPEEPLFNLIWEFISERHNLDFAYWAFNGRKYMNGAWESEAFGMMNDLYTEWRFPLFVHAMFGTV